MISQRPELAEGEQIIAAPTLIMTLPLRGVVSSATLLDTQSILIGIDRRETAEKALDLGRN